MPQMEHHTPLQIADERGLSGGQRKTSAQSWMQTVQMGISCSSRMGVLSRDVSACRWIVVWKDGGPTAAACTEAEDLDARRFYGNCSARFTNVFEGFAVEV